MLPVLRPQASVHRLEPVEALALAGRPQKPVAVRLVLHKGRPVYQGLRRVPDDVRHRLLGVDPEQVLEDGEEGDLLRRVLHPVVHGVEHVQVGGQVHVMGGALARLVTLLLLVKHIQLDLQIRIFAFGLYIP